MKNVMQERKKILQNGRNAAVLQDEKNRNDKKEKLKHKSLRRETAAYFP